MSSTSSMSSELELPVEDRMPVNLRRDVERFSVFLLRLRTALETPVSSVEGEAQYVTVHAALEMVSEAIRDLFKYENFKTNAIILASLQLVQAVKELKFDIYREKERLRVFSIVDQLEAAVLSTLLSRNVGSSPPCAPKESSTLLRRGKTQSSDTYPGSASGTQQRRHSSVFQQQSASTEDRDESFMIPERALVDRYDGVEIAFEKAKAWSKYAKELSNFVKTRLALETEHAKRISAFAEQTRQNLNENFLPLKDLFLEAFDIESEMYVRTRDMQEHLSDRVIKALDARRQEADTVRRNLKNEWLRTVKAMQDTEAEHKKAQQSVLTREDTYKKIRDSPFVTENYLSSDVARRQEKRRGREDEAFLKKEEALRHAGNLEYELKKRQSAVEVCKERTIVKLRELILQCDQTTRACAQHYFKALSALWLGVPSRYQNLADASREYEPGREYMAYITNLQQTPLRANSSQSLFRSDKSYDDLSSTGETSSLTALRRNALNPDDADAQPDVRRHKKSSAADRGFDSSDLSEAAQSHECQRSTLPSRCAQCDKVIFFYSTSCIRCSMSWHKLCFPKTVIVCGQGKSTLERRRSMFGVSLKKQLQEQRREIPLILEDIIDEIQHRGMRVKGIYRISSIRAKAEELYEMYDSQNVGSHISLGDANVLMLACVVKLYLRNLPESLLAYNDCVDFGKQHIPDSVSDSDLNDLGCMLAKLPPENYRTLRHVILHLNRVSWFASENLMPVANLSTVVTPSICFPTGTMISKNMDETPLISNTIQILIAHAHSIFNVNKATDRAEFFAKYPQDDDESADMPDDVAANDEDDRDEECADIAFDTRFVPQPSTPDLLKNARKVGVAPSECGSESSSSVGVQTIRPTVNKMQSEPKLYTTCVVVGGLGISEPLLLPASTSSTAVAAQPLSYSSVTLKTKAASPPQQGYSCGEVVLNVSEGQYFVPELAHARVEQLSPCAERHRNVFDYGSSSGYSTSECSRDDIIADTSALACPTPPSFRQRGTTVAADIVVSSKGVSHI